MILNVLERKINSLRLDTQLQQKLLNPLKFQNKFHGSNKTDILIHISFTYIKVCDKSINEGNFSQAEKVLDFIRQIMSQIYLYEQSYAWTLLKTRLIVLRIRFLQKKKDDKFVNNIKNKDSQLKKKRQKQKEVYFSRITNYCEQILKNKYYDTLKSDYYSYIEVIFMYGIRNTYKLGKFSKCLQHIQQSIGIIESQLKKLNRLLCKQDKKVYLIIESKCQILLKIYGFQVAVLSVEYKTQKQKIMDFIWQKYQNIVTQIPNMIKRQQIDKILNEILFQSQRIKQYQSQKSFQESSDKNIHAIDTNLYNMIVEPKHKIGILKIPKSVTQTLYASETISNKSPKYNQFQNKTKKSRVKFIEQSCDNSQQPIQYESISSNKSSKQISEKTLNYLSNLMHQNNPIFQSQNERNRFLSIQYSPHNYQNRNLPQTSKKIMQDKLQSLQSLENSNIKSIQQKLINENSQNTNKYKTQVEYRMRKPQYKFGSGIQKYNRTIFRVAKSYSTQENKLNIEKISKNQSLNQINLKNMIQSKQIANRKKKGNSIYIPYLK